MSEKLLKHGFLMLAGTFVANVFNYLFQLVNARILGPEQYGEFIALFSFIVLVGIPLAAFQAIITKYSSGFAAQKNLAKANHLFFFYLKVTAVFGLSAMLLIMLFSGLISGFLRIDSIIPVLLLGIAMFFMSVSCVPLAVLNGLQKFLKYVVMQVSTSAFKLAFAFSLLAIGLGLNGVLVAYAVSFVFMLLLGWFFTRPLLKEGFEKFDAMKTLQFSAVSILAFACITLFTNIDVVIVKHFFSSFETGIYGVASELAKIVFFLTSSISLVLLPKAAGDHAIRKNPKGILYKTLGFVGLVSAIAVLAYFLFPNLIISFLFGKEYIAAASLVGLFALGMAFYSLNNVLVYYFISIGRKNFALVLGFFAVLEVLLLVLFHNALSAIVSIFASTMFLLFIVLLAYSFIDRKVESSEF